jgi:4-amino-4-deoxy-L-arabinose transferase-like glycosyltransferase
MMLRAMKNRRTVLFWTAIIVLFALAIAMRLYQLGLPFDRDSYDEGVYLQSLRSMATGHTLYRDIFYSQPPFFLLSTYPVYALFGYSLWSARLGIALVSLFGLLGAVLLGNALTGRTGALAALLLAVVDPLFLMQSQSIQAEASSVAFSFLSMGLAIYWWKYPTGSRGLLLAILTGVTVALSIMCKLLGVVLLAPVALLVVARLWIVRRPDVSIIAGIVASLLTIFLLTVPFFGSFQAMWSSVVTFHIDAGRVWSSRLGQSGNTSQLETALETLLALASFYGSVTALLRRDWRVLPLLAWFFATTFLLWRQMPLFEHHFVSLTPPLVALSVMGFAVPAAGRPMILTWVAVLLVIVTVALDARTDILYYRNAAARAIDGSAQYQARVAAELREAIAPGQEVVTDAQFVAGLAERNTPPALVDTSLVRIITGSITASQLESIASDPQVHAVLFYSGRFRLGSVANFHAWVAQRFKLIHDYGSGRELWLR